MQIYWVQDHQIEPVMWQDDRGVMLSGRGLLTWAEARRLHAEDPENGLLYIALAGTNASVPKEEL